jgi:hypothetical protein
VIAVWHSWTATSSGSGVTLTSGAATKIVLSGSTSGLASGATRILTATIEDSAGNTVTSGADSGISVAFAQTAGPGSVTGTGAASASAGVATDTVTGAIAGAVTLQTSGTLSGPGATSSNTLGFAVSVGSATKLAFTTSPSNSTGGTAFATQPKLTVEDAGGNTVTTDATTATLAISAGTPASGGPGTLSGCTQSETSGVITFAGCKIDKTGTGYTLTATDGSLTSATSATFNITVGGAAKLAFTQSPSDSTGGTAFAAQPKVAVEDAGGNVATTDTSGVTLTIGTNPAGGTLTCTTNPLNASSGIATFAGCKIDKAGTGYTLTATDGSLTSATSASFNITVGGAAKLVFTTSPSNTTGGTAFATQPVVAVEDAGGNVVTTDASGVTLTIGTNPSGGTLTCTTNPLNASSGIATFAGCKIDKAGTGYTLTATDGTLTSATSATFNITGGTAAKLVFTTSPSNTTGGTAFATQPKVTVEDAGGNVVTTDTSGVTLTIGTNPAGGTLTCTTNPLNASSGVATFAGCKIDKAGTGYTLTATDGSLTSATSATFNITVGGAAKLAFTQSPSNSPTGTAFATQPKVAVEDAGGNVVTTDTSGVTLTIGTNPAGGTLTCTTNPANASSGIATFAGCKIDNIGTGYTLTAADGSLTSATSASFNITAGAATQLVLTGSTASLASGSTRTLTATIEDAAGNTVSTGTDSTDSITFAKTTGAGTVTGLTTVAAVGGVATDTVTGSLAGSITVQANGTLNGVARTSSTLTFTVTGLTFTAMSINNKTGGTVGQSNAGDTIVITYSQGLKLTTVCSTSTLSNTASGSITPNASSTTVTLMKNSGGTLVTFASTDCTLHLGTITLGGVYVNGANTNTVTYGGSTVAWNGSNTITITLGNTVGGNSTPAQITTATAGSLPADTNVTDLAGNPLSGTANSNTVNF